MGQTERLNPLVGMGAKLAIDDFGTGYSSYGMLPKLPLNTPKIGRSFTQRLDEPSGRSALAGIRSLAESLGFAAIGDCLRH